MNLTFDQKVTLITGGASGIGLATAQAFAQAGASVAIADLDASAANRAAAALVASGHRAIGIACDVADEAQVAAMVVATIDAFGRLDIAFNNAGIHVAVAETAAADLAEFDRLNAINYRGIWACMKHELSVMCEQGSGAIVNCSSQSGMVGTAGLGPYTASKHAVIGLTRSAALEYARRGIRINAVCPGSVLTPMVERAFADEPETMNAVKNAIPLGRLGNPQEIAAAVMFLAHPAASFVIGHALVVDGGYTIL